MTHWTDRLTQLDACSDAVKWARGYDSLDTAWAACERADWMLWLAARVCEERGSEAHKRLVLAACACARTALRYVPDGEDRPRITIETAERWGRGETTDAELDAAWAAGDAGDAAGAAASAAAWAAWAAGAAWDAGAAAWAAARDAAWAASDAAWAASDAAGAAAWAAALRDMAVMLRREHYPTPPAKGGEA